MDPVRTLIADDHPIFRGGLRTLLSADDLVDVVGEAVNGSEAVALAEELQPDVVVMDIQMPELNGIEATRQIVSRSPHVGVLVLTMFEDDDSVFAAMRAGARGYMLKGAGAGDIARAIRDGGGDYGSCHQVEEPGRQALTKHGAHRTSDPFGEWLRRK